MRLLESRNWQLHEKQGGVGFAERRRIPSELGAGFVEVCDGLPEVGPRLLGNDIRDSVSSWGAAVRVSDGSVNFLCCDLGERNRFLRDGPGDVLSINVIDT